MNEDLGLDLYEYGFRWYNSKIGRFISVDPIAEEFPHVSTYNYAENRVPNGIDLWGLQFISFLTNSATLNPVTTVTSTGGGAAAAGSTLPKPMMIVDQTTLQFESESTTTNESSSNSTTSTEGQSETKETEEKKDKSGIAVIHKENGTEDNPFGHYSVEVYTDDSKLHTEQVIVDDEMNTQIDIVNFPSTDEKRLVRLPNAEAAINFQKSMTGKRTGKYNKYNNNCINHVCDVLSAGGVNVPSNSREQYIEAIKIFKK